MIDQVNNIIKWARTLYRPSLHLYNGSTYSAVAVAVVRWCLCGGVGREGTNEPRTEGSFDCSDKI